MVPRLKTGSRKLGGGATTAAAALGLLSQDMFLRMLCLERKRAERSRKGFVLMLLESGTLLSTARNGKTLETIRAALDHSTRDTDIKGWYRDKTVLGIIFTEIALDEGRELAKLLLSKVTNALCAALNLEHLNLIRITVHAFPADWDLSDPGGPIKPTLEVDLGRYAAGQKIPLQVKRLIDIAGSLFAIVVCLPVFAAIAIGIKLTSRGPVLFRQARLGQYGTKFTFLKFRSMYYQNDPSIHEQYVRRFIAGKVNLDQNPQSVSFKLAKDPRITPLGRFLRKTSLDELPQFFNVLKGDMSLVGPRPPVTYEFESYDIWHKQRLLHMKPGITGLWQVEGRSRVTFDDMVRLDIRYARRWSLTLDIKILLQTPRAVISGDGAC